MDIKHPITFSEKLNWLKKHPVVFNEAELADKYDVRDFIKRTIGEQYLIPILGVWGIMLLILILINCLMNSC